MTFEDLKNNDDGIGKYVRSISTKEARPFLMNIHYARRMPCIQYAFGLFVDEELIGVVTYGVPASPPLCKGLAGEKNFHNVLELNRLVIAPDKNGKNHASYLVSKSLKMLPNRTFVVSYADTAWSHVGYVYQATNFLYTGATASRTDVYIPNGSHPRHYERNGQDGMRQSRSSKHRYVYLVGDKRTRKQMRKELKYPVLGKYPKGDEVKYDTHDPQPIKPIEVIDGGE